jgi:hypothetical protein
MAIWRKKKWSLKGRQKPETGKRFPAGTPKLFARHGGQAEQAASATAVVR